MLFNDYVSQNFYYFNIIQKNVKTIIFSELPQQDKIKYFNFLLENDINFSRDESGNYVALVKVLNPAFYGKDQNNNKKENKTSSPKKKENKDSKKLDKNFGNDNNINNNIYKEEKGSLKSKKRNDQFEKEKKLPIKKVFQILSMVDIKNSLNQ